MVVVVVVVFFLGQVSFVAIDKRFVTQITFHFLFNRHFRMFVCCLIQNAIRFLPFAITHSCTYVCTYYCMFVHMYIRVRSLDIPLGLIALLFFLYTGPETINRSTISRLALLYLWLLLTFFHLALIKFGKFYIIRVKRTLICVFFFFPLFFYFLQNVFICLTEPSTISVSLSNGTKALY